MSKSNLDEYIKRSEAIEALEDDYNLCFATDPTIDTPYYKMKRAAVRVITGVHAANVAPIIKGKWISKEICINPTPWVIWSCSNCGYVRSRGYSYNGGEKPYAKFCENCGAHMEMEDENE